MKKRSQKSKRKMVGAKRAVVPMVGTPQPARLHRDYRIVFNDAMNAGRELPGALGWWVAHRDAFEDLFNEHPVAALMRAIGRYETAHFELRKTTIAHDLVLGKCWLTMFFEVRRLLNGVMLDLDAVLCERMLVALALNAGFEESDLS